jgi:biopolymer transport protein ExbB
MKYLLLTLLLILLLSLPAAHLEAAQPRLDIETLIEQVRTEARDERRHNREREARFVAERDRQKQRLAELKAQVAQAEAHAEKLRGRFEQNEETLIGLDEQLQKEAGDLGDLFAVVRQNAAELRSLMWRSMVSAQYPERADFLDRLGAGTGFSISMDQLKQVWILLLEEINQAGKVVRFEAPVITTKGEEVTSTVTRSGVFTATSQGRFLRYLPESGKLVELVRQPALRYREMAAGLEQAGEGLHAMAVDPTKGSILGLLVRSPDLAERIRQGGSIGYLILLLGAAGLLIVVYRYIWLVLVDRRMKRQHNSDAPGMDNPLGRLKATAAEVAQASAEVLSMRFEETINTEARRLNFGLTTLTVFAAVAPLLGLLGTVTGMIETFQSISLFGTGDPKLMSSGISQAMITTQLGLVVAIPLLLAHSFLHGKANGMVALLEQQGSRLFEINGREVSSRD